MIHPLVEVDLKKLRHNLSYLSSYIHDHQMTVAGVTKVFSAHPVISQIYDEVPTIDYLADSRLVNFDKYPKDSKKEKLFLRIPMLSEVPDLVKKADISLNSKIQTIRKINEEAEKQDKVHHIILMIDLGDLREGVFEESEVYDYVEEILNLKHVKLRGIGVNLTCYGAIIPDKATLSQLTDYKDEIEKRFDFQLDIISGGNSSSLYLLDPNSEGLPEGVNMLRIGEAFVLGKETAYGKNIPKMHQDVFTLKAEIIEYRDKPSLPIGNVGRDAFGNQPTFVDKGIMRRGILAIGRQDIDIENIIPRDDRLEVIGASSDHLIVDFTGAKDDYQLGDVVDFDLSYGALLNAFTSDYVNKKFINQD